MVPLDPVKNGLIVVKDPQALLYLGYGFNQPKAGIWQVSLLTTEETPVAGSDYALSAYFEGGARLEALASSLLPRQGETVHLNARLQSPAGSARMDTVQGKIENPSGEEQTLTFSPQGDGFQADWKAAQPGIYAIDIQGEGKAADGTPITRSAFVTLEVQADQRPQLIVLFALFGAIIAIIGVGTILVFRRLAQTIRGRGRPTP